MLTESRPSISGVGRACFAVVTIYSVKRTSGSVISNVIQSHFEIVAAFAPGGSERASL